MRMVEDVVTGEVLHEFAEQIEAFRRNFLIRVVALLAASAWGVGMVALFLERTAVVALTLLGFEALCWVSYRLCIRNWLRWAQYLLATGAGLWSLGLVWLAPDPALLFVPVLVAPIGVAVLETAPAVVLSLLLASGQLLGAAMLFPGDWITWQNLLAPLLTLVATALALIWGLNQYTVLGWATHSTRTAVERLEEVQEHRAQLRRSMEELDAAVQRLERANEMLAAARAEAEAARQARNQFALTVSHELRTPLNFIIGFSELMVTSPETYAEPARWPPGLYDDIREIYSSSNHLMRLVNDILELGQSEARRLILAREWMAPAVIVQEAETMLRAATAAQSLYLHVDLEPDLPELFVDRTRIRQVLINLIGNSLRFTEEGGITLRVRRRATDVVFCVEDTGVGIPAEEIAKVFEDFGQANTTVWRRRGGSGLGVPISRRFVEMHGGRMWVESEVGKGTAFYFALPMPGAVAEPLEAERDEDGWQHASARARSTKAIVVFSADPSAGSLVEGIISGYRVVAADNAEAAARHVENLLPHALIVDQSLTDQAGHTGLIDNLPYDIPVIFIPLRSTPGARVSSSQSALRRTPGDDAVQGGTGTGDGPPDLRRLPPGVQGHLVKPVRRQELVEAVQRLPDVCSLLVVDDDPAMARYVRLALAAAQGPGIQEGAIEVRVALSGQQVLDQYLRTSGSADGSGSEQPDAVLLDIRLPDMSGWDVLEAIRQEPSWRDVPVILVTAADLSEEMGLHQREVLQVSMSRPLTGDELSAALRSLLESLRPMARASHLAQLAAGAPARPGDPSA